MTNVQYLNTVRDLFPGLQFEDPLLPNENVVGGFSTTATGQTASSVFIEAYEQAASRIAEAAKTQFSMVEPCQPADADAELACAQGFISGRRPTGARWARARGTACWRSSRSAGPRMIFPRR
jgi:hypothetical protein